MSLFRDVWGKISGEPEKKQSVIGRKTVVDAYEDVIVPMLREHGFETFKNRTAWRHTEKRIDVVELQFFPKAKTAQWGITPYSFALPVGCFFPFVPSLYEPRLRREKGLPLPDETQCHLRKTTLKALKQRECKIPNIWYIDPKDKYLSAAIEDAKNLLEGEIFSWFEHFNDLPMLLKNLTEGTERKSIGMTLGAGPIEGFLALEIGEWSLAKKLLQQALDTSFLTPGLVKCMQSDRKFIEGITKVEATLNSELHAGIAKAEAALRGSA